MAEVEWSEEGEEAPKKKGGIPKWLWIGCGAGCLFFLLVVIVLAIMAGKFFSDFTDPEVAWAEIQEVLPYDERPEGWEAMGKRIPFINMGQYFLSPPEGRAQLIVMRMPSMRELEDFFEPESASNTGFMGVGKIRDPDVGQIEIQGREVRCLRFMAWMPESAEEKGVTGTSIRVDVTGKGSIPVLIQVTLGSDTERVEDELVQELLKPFDVWRGR